jgi:hypothetical protein
MEWTPENCPVAVVFHSNRRTEDLFCGGKDIVHGISNGLLVLDVSWLKANCELTAQITGDGSQSLSNR